MDVNRPADPTIDDYFVHDRTAVTELEAALDALETLHDFQADQIGSEHIRQCLCGEAASYRRARQVTDGLRLATGLKARID